MSSSVRVALGLLVVGLLCGWVVPSAVQAKVAYRDGTFTSHNAGYPMAGAPPPAILSSVVVRDDVLADRTSFKVTLAGAPPSSEQAPRLTVGLGKYNVNGECVLVGYASATENTWLEQAVNNTYFGYAFSRSGNVINAQVYQGTVAPHAPSDEGFDCGGAVLDFHADDGTPYNFGTQVASTDRMLGRLTAPRSKPVLKSKKLDAKSGKVKARVGCSSAADCRGRLSISYGKAALGKATYAVSKGKSKLVTVKLTKKAKRLLARHRKLKVTVTLTPTEGAKVTKKLTMTR